MTHFISVYLRAWLVKNLSLVLSSFLMFFVQLCRTSLECFSTKTCLIFFVVVSFCFFSPQDIYPLSWRSFFIVFAKAKAIHPKGRAQDCLGGNQSPALASAGSLFGCVKPRGHFSHF